MPYWAKSSWAWDRARADAQVANCSARGWVRVPVHLEGIIENDLATERAYIRPPDGPQFLMAPEESVKAAQVVADCAGADLLRDHSLKLEDIEHLFDQIKAGI